MTAASTYVVRLLLHMAMYLGATESPQVVADYAWMKLFIATRGCVLCHMVACFGIQQQF